MYGIVYLMIFPASRFSMASFKYLYLWRIGFTLPLEGDGNGIKFQRAMLNHFFKKPK